MKKSIKCLSAVLMTSVLAVSAGAMAMPAFADDPTYKITLTSTANHSYTAYQIFSGKYHKSGDTETLADIKWNDAVIDSTAVLTDLAAWNTTDFTTTMTASDVAKKIATYSEDDTNMRKIAQIFAKNIKATAPNKGDSNLEISGLSAGYYLIKDTTTTLPSDSSTGSADTYSAFMLKVAGDVSIAAKDGTVQSSKTVTETDDTAPTTTKGQKAADYDIGDSIAYELTFTLPADLDRYETYPLTFTDDMCAGLDWGGDAMIYYGPNDENGKSIKFSSVTSTKYTNGKTWTYNQADILDSSNTNSKALAAGNVITIKYNAVLNANAAVNDVGNPNDYHVTFNNNPNNSGSGTTDKGNTPDDTTVVFTYELVFNKVDDQATPQPLTGADFKLEKNVGGTWTDVTALHTGASAINPSKTDKLTGTAVDTSATTSFSFKGLDAGSYKLTEITTPDGYNTIAPIEFTVTTTKSGTAVTNIGSTVLSSPTVTFNSSDAKIAADIQNNKGVTLPGTGGIGTTIFYIIGGLMTTGALVLFIVKKRMNIKEK